MKWNALAPEKCTPLDHLSEEFAMKHFFWILLAVGVAGC
jgi:hypothetical protein